MTTLALQPKFARLCRTDIACRLANSIEIWWKFVLISRNRDNGAGISLSINSPKRVLSQISSVPTFNFLEEMDHLVLVIGDREWNPLLIRLLADPDVLAREFD